MCDDAERHRDADYSRGRRQVLPKKGETVAVHYTMSLADGTEVDNTYKRRSAVSASRWKAVRW